MEISKKILKDAGVLPELVLGNKTEHGVIPTGAHTVKLLKDKEVMDEEDGKPCPKVRYLVEENSEMKTYDTRKFKKGTEEISYLVKRLAAIPENTEVILEMKKERGKNFISVKAVAESVQAEIESDEEIPIINEDQPTDTSK